MFKDGSGAALIGFPETITIRRIAAPNFHRLAGCRLSIERRTLPGEHIQGVEAGIPSAIFGPAGEGLHGVNEWVDLESVLQCQEIVLATLREFCA